MSNTAPKSKFHSIIRNKFLSYALKFLIGVSLLYFLLVNSPSFTKSSLNLFAHPERTAVVIIVIWMTQIVVAVRYFLFLRVVAPVVRFRDIFLVTSIGQFLAQTFLGPLASDVSRLSLLNKTPGLRLPALTGSMIIDRVISLYGLIIAAGIGLAVALHHSLIVNNHAVQFIVFPIVILMAFGLLCLILLGLIRVNSVQRFFKKILVHRIKHESILTFLFAIKYISQTPKLLGIGVLLSIASQLMPILAFAFLMGSDWLAPFTAEQVILCLPLALLANMLPITPAGLGVGEAAFEFLTSDFVPHGQGVILFLQYRVMGIIAAFPGVIGLIFFRMRPNALSSKKVQCL